MSNPSPMRGKTLVPNLRYERNLKGYGRFKSYAFLSKILKTSQGYASFYIYVTVETGDPESPGTGE